LDRFATACRDFGLTISLKKTKVLAQDVDDRPSIKISNYELVVVNEFVYLGSNISDKLAAETEINRRIGQAATTYSILTKRVWENKKLTHHTKAQVYTACVVSTLLYVSETWTLCSRQEKFFLFSHEMS
jgi:hypothetical protein